MAQVFTVSEGKVLRALDRSRPNFVPDLAVAAQLTPSAARQAVENLVSRDLVTVREGFFNLTSKGYEARNFSVHHPESAIADEVETTEEQDIERELDLEVAKLGG